MWALIAVTLPFRFAIAVLKDVPDIEGDRRFGIATFSVRLGAAAGLPRGRRRPHCCAGSGWRSPGRCCSTTRTRRCSSSAQLRGVGRSWRWALRVDPTDPVAFTAFYQRVWQLFFCEYVVVTAAYLVG